LSDFIVYSCKKNKEYFKSYNVNSKKLFFFPCAVDNKNIRNLFKKKEKKENFFYAGKIIERKNLDFLIDGFINFNKNLTSNLYIIGNGYIKDKLKEKYKNYKFIKFVGHMNYTKLFKYINKNMKYFIITSNYDPSPKIINECLNLKIPIICSSNIGTAGDLVRNNFNGLIYKSGDKQHFLRQLKKIKNNYHKLYKNCHLSLKKWDDAISVKNMLKISKYL
jgi:glycosyltransferase involved in cell wall biosynthesis